MSYICLTPAELARRYPFFNTSEVSYGLATESGGILFADTILKDLVRSIKKRGAYIVEEFEADMVDVKAAQARAKDGRALQGDILIAAIGTETGKIFGDMLGERLTAMRSSVLYVAPPESWLPSVSDLPCWISLGGEDGLWGVPPINGIPMKIGCSRETTPGDPSAGHHVTKVEIERILANYRTRFADFGAVRLLHGLANYWTMAPEGRFVFRQIDRCFVLSACSGHGFKFGALTGQDVAEAITSGRI
jgi:sarcosine oxidase